MIPGLGPCKPVSALPAPPWSGPDAGRWRGLEGRRLLPVLRGSLQLQETSWQRQVTAVCCPSPWGPPPREIRDEELGKFCARVCALLRKEDWGPGAVDALRRLFLIVSATKYSRRLEKPCVALLQTTLCSPTCPEQLQLLCAAVLREMSPSDSPSLSCDHIQGTRQLDLVASVLLAQGDQQQVRSLGQCVLKVLESRQPEGPSLRHLLPIVSKVTSLAPDALREEQTRALSKRLGDWLRYASVQQGVAHSSGGFFSTPRARQLGPVTEVDGAVATDFFTVLSTGQRFTEDQWLNVQAFSMLRAWLLDSSPGGSSAPDVDDRSELEGSTLSVLSAASAAGHPLPPQEWLQEKAFEYCQRLLEQSSRRALRKADSDLQKACLVEAVLVLDVLCRQDPSFLYRTLSCLRPLYTRLRGDPAWVRALLPVARFFLRHGEAAAVDAEAVYQHLFTGIPAEHFHSPMLAFEFVQFCRDSLPLLGRNLGVLRTSFPNLFKFLAWNSPPLTSDFVALLPSLVDAGTAVEMLHLLLDLPCLTAALDLQLRSLQTASERPPWDVSIRAPGCLEAFRDSQVQGLFQHLLRAQASGTAERLTPLYRLLQPLAGCARVVQCAEAVPTLLRAFFSAVTQVSPLPGASVPAAEGRPEPGPTGPQLPRWPRGRSVTADRAAHTSPGPAPVPPRTGAERSPQGSSSQPGPEQRCSLGVGRSLSLSLSSPQFADGVLASQLALLLLERSDSLYQVPGYEAGVHRWVPPGGLRPPCSSMAQPWTGSLTLCSPPLTATVPQLPQTPPQPRRFLGHRKDRSLPTQAPLPRSLPEHLSPLLKEGPVHAGSSPLQPSLLPGGARGSWRGRDYLCLHLVLGGLPPPPSSSRDGPRGWGPRGASTARVSSPAGCWAPSSRPCASCIPRWWSSRRRSCWSLWAAPAAAGTCSRPWCGPSASTCRCPGTGGAPWSRSTTSSKPWRPCSSRSPSRGPPPPFPSVLRRSSPCS
ncbi:AP-5 complex subunit zeta-1 isoform X2 [Physeter macrocephalus]|uniref:AP-5 complex subunit zeta-1 isoform X2 n=1 Tax=Physeter macrocephalus TaxID=9755 RepID=A0A9W2X578_PHYMC|nr:AP-5 complex subunit zeta-1 isoform X2 [Physeter catodon]